MTRIEEELKKRILILDGAMGTMIQRHKLDENAYRGKEFKDHPSTLKGNNDLLSITQSKIIEDIHRAYLEAGADIIETNTFNSTSVSMADYGMQKEVAAINRAAAALAKKAAQDFTAKDPAKPRFVAGAIGPTTRTASLSPNVNDAGFRAITFDGLVSAYAEQIQALLDGGVALMIAKSSVRE